MPKYKYTARDQQGNSVSGTIQASDHGELQRMLRTNGLFLTEASGSTGPVTNKKKDTKAGLFEPKVSPLDLVIATRQLATFLRAGVSILEALEVVGLQSSKPALQAVFAEIGRGVSQGRPLSSEMRRYPKTFSSIVISLVEAGETAGTLDKTLEVAAFQLEREENLRQRVKGAMIYPKIVVLACVGTIAGMITLVVPTFAQVYKSLHTQLPAPTLLLIAVSDVSVHYWWAAVLMFFGSTYLYKRFRDTPTGRRKLDAYSLKVPVLGILNRKIAIARFVQTLGGALKGGVPIIRALSISAATADNVILRDSILECIENVRNGAQVAAELERTGQFPMMVTRMIGAGEITGNVDQMLEEINRFYEQDVETAVTRMTKLIEPAMTVMVGAIVLLILLGLYMPIFNLGKAFSHQK